MTSNNDEVRLCPNCDTAKPLSEYHWVKRTQRYHYCCKKCANALQRKYYERRRDERNAKQLAYSKTPKGKVARRKAILNAWSRHPEKMQARLKMTQAINNAVLKKTNCEECDNPKVEGHHYLGYDEAHWLDVQWLCRYHHRKAHGFYTQSFIKQREAHNG
jgi:hypothetical protein